MAVAVFDTPQIQGSVVVSKKEYGSYIVATFTKLPPGKHGFHIHESGDLRDPGCMGACAHFHKGKKSHHGDRPGRSRERHTGDLGNVEVGTYRYRLTDVLPEELWGRALIVHAEEDDLGKGEYPDSKTTGHSGARIGCSIFGRIKCPQKK